MNTPFNLGLPGAALSTAGAGKLGLNPERIGESCKIIYVLHKQCHIVSEQVHHVGRII